MRICPDCGEVYGDEVALCAADGGPLGEWDATPEDAPAADEEATSRERARAAPHARKSAPRPGRVLGDRYLLLKQIGVGGFGVVFEAEDKRLLKRVAVKVLSPQRANRQGTLARFHREAVAAGRVGHEGIVDVTDFDHDDDGTHFIVMEYLDGTELAKVVKDEAPLPARRALAIAAQIADALSAAHDKGIVHRDLKPSNIYLVARAGREPAVKILDFGISKMISHEEASPLTGTGQVVGTPHYMAPEQATGEEELDGRVDVYALGIILYELLTGRRPFTGGTSLAVISKHLKATAVPPSMAVPEAGIPAEADDLVLRALAKKPADRWPDMRAFHEALVAMLVRMKPTRAASAPVVAPRVEAATEAEAAGEPGRVPTTLGLASGQLRSASRSAWSVGRVRLLLIGGAAVAALAIVLAVGLGGGDRAGSTAPSPGTADPVPSPAPAPVPSAAPDPPPAPATVSVHLTLDPADARVELDGAPIAENPFRLPRGAVDHRLVVSARGRVTAARTIRADADADLAIELAPAPRKPARRPQPKKPGRALPGPFENTL